MRILIVEDNDRMRGMIKSFILDLTEEIYECTDGAQALSAYRQHRPDWVLMDIKMKQVDGMAATREIVAAFPAAKIMIVTNYDDPQLRQAAFLAGACEYRTKENLLDVRQLLAADLTPVGIRRPHERL